MLPLKWKLWAIHKTIIPYPVIKITLQPPFSHSTHMPSLQGYWLWLSTKQCYHLHLIHTMVFKNLQSRTKDPLYFHSLLEGHFKCTAWTAFAGTPNDAHINRTSNIMKRFFTFSSINQHHWFLFDKRYYSWVLMPFLDHVNDQSKLYNETNTQQMMFCPFSFFPCY